MTTLTLLILGVGTSVGAYLFGTRLLRLSPAALRESLGRLAELIGVAVAFFVINVTAVVVMTFVVRAAGRFVSLYGATDPILIGLSLIQAAAFQFWRYSNGHTGKE